MIDVMFGGLLTCTDVDEEDQITDHQLAMYLSLAHDLQETRVGLGVCCAS